MASIKSHFPIRDRPGIPLRLATWYSCWRLRSSSAGPAWPPRRRPLAACFPSSRRVLLGGFRMVGFFMEACWAFLMLGLAALVFLLEVIAVTSHSDAFTWFVS